MSCHLSVTTACYNVVDINAAFLFDPLMLLHAVGFDSDA